MALTQSQQAAQEFLDVCDRYGWGNPNKKLIMQRRHGLDTSVSTQKPTPAQETKPE